ncbi:hypothetical protein XU06_06055 [Rhodococcus erythropolis]|uniref:hypothetical protein n=1 Tax=Rhodococcus erythropolis TaxID=1833 RepID=UPI00061B7B67|nr:hypothetical protein [Rhodococcus erythropolis]AKD96380.1 hypothetical protein XU06_06055 [Rhodococcus erythropolis]
MADADGTGWTQTSYDFQIPDQAVESTTSMARAYWPNTRPEHHPRTVVELDVDDPAGRCTTGIELLRNRGTAPL